jgi:hypothetical protein
MGSSKIESTAMVVFALREMVEDSVIKSRFRCCFGIFLPCSFWNQNFVFEIT